MSLNSKENINIFAQVICDAFSNMFYHKGPLSVEGDLPERVYISVPFPSAIKCDSSLCTILDEDLRQADFQRHAQVQKDQPWI